MNEIIIFFTREIHKNRGIMFYAHINTIFEEISFYIRVVNIAQGDIN